MKLTMQLLELGNGWNEYWNPFYLHEITSIPTWISNPMLNKVWGEITYPFPNFNGCNIEVWEWINNFTPYFIRDVLAYPCWDLRKIMLMLGAPSIINEVANADGSLNNYLCRLRSTSYRSFVAMHTLKKLFLKTGLIRSDSQASYWFSTFW